MDGARRSTRIARRNTTADVAGKCRSPSQHQLRTVITTMLIRVDANPGDISTEASGSSSRVTTDPKHKKILKILLKAKVSIGGAQADVAVSEDLRRALLTRGHSQALS
jgi:hypothetical protein